MNWDTSFENTIKCSNIEVVVYVPIEEHLGKRVVHTIRIGDLVVRPFINKDFKNIIVLALSGKVPFYYEGAVYYNFIEVASLCIDITTGTIVPLNDEEINLPLGYGFTITLNKNNALI